MGHRRTRARTEVATAPARGQAGVLASLRERKVVQWTLAYAAAAFALLQVLQLVGAAFAWPPWTVQGGIVIAALGAVATAVVAWFHGDRGAQRVSGTELLLLAGLLLAGAGWVWHLRGTAVATADPAPRLAAAAAAPGDAVIAVLPFDNLGPAADAGFVDGLHDETISRLATMDAFAVISRTSTLAFREARPNLRAIAAELGATHVLEGTVQRDGGRIRLRVQFIDARTDAHLFARTIDRDATRLFEAQALLAVEIAEALRARLRPDALARLERQPTPSAEAYAAYLQARQEWIGNDLNDDPAALDAQLDRALQLDAAFVEALALRAVHDAERAFNDDDVAVRGPRARDAVRQLRQIAPDHPLAWLAEGKVRYHLDLDYVAARPLLERALAAMPNDPVALNALAWLEKRLGNHAQAAVLFERMARLDPRSLRMLGLLGLHYSTLGDQAALLDVAERALALDPQNPYLMFGRAQARRAAFGDAGPVRALAAQARARADELPAAMLLGVFLDVDDCRGIELVLDRMPETLRVTVGFTTPPSDLLRAHCLQSRGDTAGAASAARRALALLDTQSPPGKLAGHVEVWRGHALGLAGQRERGLAAVARGRAMAQAGGDAVLAGEVDYFVLTALSDLGDYAGAAKVARESLERPFPRGSPGELLATAPAALLANAPGLAADLRRRLDQQVAALPPQVRAAASASREDAEPLPTSDTAP